MNRRDFVNRFKYTILAALTVVTLVYGYYLYRTYFPAEAPPPSITVTVTAAGAVTLDGTLYTTPEALKPKVAEIQRAHPGAGFSITARHGEDFEGVAKAIVLLKQSGAEAVWVTNEPAKDEAKP